MITLHFLPILTLLAALQVTIGNSATDLSIAIIALLIAIIGPFAGSYMFIKNANKMFGMMAGGVNKLGSPFKKLASGFAKDHNERSLLGTYMADRKRNDDTWAKIRNRERISQFSNPDAKYERGPLKGKRTMSSRMGMSRLVTAGMNDRAAQSFRAQLTGQDNAVYREEVEAFKQKLGRDYSTKGQAQEHLWKRLQDGDASAAEMHALHDHIMSQAGGASYMDAVYAGQVKDSMGNNIGHYMMQDVKRTGGKEAWLGAQRSLTADGSKFRGGSADAAYQVQNRANDYVAALAAGEQDAFLGTNAEKGNTATFHNAKGQVVTEDVIVGSDGNGGLEYWGERAKNMGQFGSRMAYAMEASGQMTDQAASLIAADTQKASQDEHVVYEVALRHLEKMKQNGGTLNPAKNRNPNPQPNPTPAIQLQVQSSSGTTQAASASEIIAQVQRAGGWDNLSHESVMNIYNHVNTLPNSVESTQLGSSAIDELRKRGIFTK